MGYALMSARKIMLTSKINRLNFQIMCLSQAQESVSNNMNNLQRLMNMGNNWNNAMQQYSFMSQLMGGSSNFTNYLASMMGGGCSGLSGCNGLMNSMGGLFGSSYSSPMIGSDWSQLFWPYAQASMIEDDIETQKKQLETQLQVATKELEAVEKAEESAIGRATPKYA